MNARKKRGFSLMEVNIAVFVMATGVLAIVGLFPLGMRESILSQMDFKRAMFADYVLNIAVAAACSTNVTWNEWHSWANTYNTLNVDINRGWNENVGRSSKCVPDFIWTTGESGEGGRLGEAISAYGNKQNTGFQHASNTRDLTYAVYCVVVPGFSDRTMGIMVRSLEMDTRKMSDEEKRRRLEIQPVYYAEARFQGKP